MSAPPPAAGVRVEWEALPGHVRRAVEDWAGEQVVEAETQRGGFSPGLAAKLRFPSGRRVFVKAVNGINPFAPVFHRREAAIVQHIPSAAPVPRLQWWTETEDGWVILAFDCVDGRQPAQPWEVDELQRVMEALAEISAALEPSPVPLEVAGPIAEWALVSRPDWQRVAKSTDDDGFDAWSLRHASRLAELAAEAPKLASGTALVHLDVRADNLLLDERRVWLVDWPHARVGAAWTDVICMAPSVAMQGGPPPEELFRMHPGTRTADPDAVNAFLAAITGFLTAEAQRPPPPGLPTLRPFQKAQAVVARRWLSERLGLD